VAGWLVRSQSLTARAIRFGAVGTVTSAGFALMVAGLVGWVTEPVAAALAYLLLVPVNYLGHRRATFRSRAPTGTELARYLAVHGATLLVCASMMQGVTAGLGQSHWVGSAAIVVLAPVMNFSLLHLWVFRRANPSGTASGGQAGGKIAPTGGCPQVVRPEQLPCH